MIQSGNSTCEIEPPDSSFKYQNAFFEIMLTFNKNYFRLAILIFAIEVLIALFVRDNFVRPYLGDVLVVILIYCFIMSFLRLPVFTVAIGVLVFSFSLEFLQALHIVEKQGLEKSPIARTVIGTLFEWIDLAAYVAGIVIIILAEKYWLKKSLRVCDSERV
jgi:hypothetical protein